MRMNLVKVGDIERIKHAALTCRECKMILIRSPDRAGFQRGEYIYSARAQTANHIAVHGIFVNIETNPTQAEFAEGGNMRSITASSAAMSASTSIRFAW